MEKKILNIVIGAIVNNGKILLLKRNKEPFKDLWGMPGGKIEFGETIEKAIIREINEETGLKTKFINLKGILNEYIKENKLNIYHAIIFVCELRPSTHKHIDSNEGELKWFLLSKLNECKDTLIPSDFLMIKRFIIGKQKAEYYKMKITKIKNSYKIKNTDLI